MNERNKNTNGSDKNASWSIEQKDKYTAEK